MYKVDLLPPSFTSDASISKCCSMLKIYDVRYDVECFKMTQHHLVSSRARYDVRAVKICHILGIDQESCVHDSNSARPILNSRRRGSHA